MEKLKPYQAYSHRIHGACCDHPDLYGVWRSMKSRCENPNREKFKSYGKRGISVCAEWHDSWNFVKWALLNGYQKGLQLDRIDNDKGYSPENCRWATPKQNSRNRRNTKFLTVNGTRKCISEWSEVAGISPYTIYYWVREKGATYAEQRLSEIA
jgi:hypothetical protein